jgi:predicted acylesterase/phospholipase RssA
MRRAWIAKLALCAACLVLSGCVSLPRIPYAATEQALATPPGFENVRYNEDDPRLPAMLRASLRPDSHNQINALAISGGGANGSYGAGLLYRWSAVGERPQFALVTGVSTGALTAPFAFLGRDWDERLKAAYFSPEIAHLLQNRGLKGLFTPGIFSRAPLNNLVRGAVTDELIAAVAAEHAKGRRLLVATTNLDSEALVVWDMGAIAARGGPAARQLFGTVLIASASVPGVFPPTLIPVQSGAHAYNELHVDGQAVGAFFAIPQTVLLANTSGLQGRAQVNLFIIVNGRLDGLFQVTPRSAISILARSLDTANKSSIRTMLISTAEFCQRTGCALRVSALPDTATDDPLDFRPDHIAHLFEAGEAGAGAWSHWKTTPPPPIIGPAP